MRSSPPTSVVVERPVGNPTHSNEYSDESDYAVMPLHRDASMGSVSYHGWTGQDRVYHIIYA